VADLLSHFQDPWPLKLCALFNRTKCTLIRAALFFKMTNYYIRYISCMDTFEKQQLNHTCRKIYSQMSPFSCHWCWHQNNDMVHSLSFMIYV